MRTRACRSARSSEASAYRSRTATTNHGIPAFIDDPLIGLGGEVQLREHGPKPVLGFCGQAGASLPRHAARLVRNKLRRVRWHLWQAACVAALTALAVVALRTG